MVAIETRLWRAAQSWEDRLVEVAMEVDSE
jgi:hypothetical protein